MKSFASKLTTEKLITGSALIRRTPNRFGGFDRLTSRHLRKAVLLSRSISALFPRELVYPRSFMCRAPTAPVAAKRPRPHVGRGKDDAALEIRPRRIVVNPAEPANLPCFLTQPRAPTAEPTHMAVWSIFDDLEATRVPAPAEVVSLAEAGPCASPCAPPCAPCDAPRAPFANGPISAAKASKVRWPRPPNATIAPLPKKKINAPAPARFCGRCHNPWGRKFCHLSFCSPKPFSFLFFSFLFTRRNCSLPPSPAFLFLPSLTGFGQPAAKFLANQFLPGDPQKR